MTELFGPDYNLDQLDMHAILLDRAPLQTLTAAKLKSISDKYDIIPSKFLSYYPERVDTTDEDITDDLPPPTIAKPSSSAKHQHQSLQAHVSSRSHPRSQ
jgi:hypothetical protein